MADKKPKEQLGLGVSTNVEKAWYVHPELLAGQEEASKGTEVTGPEPDKTVTLEQTDLEEAMGELDEEAQDARHYKEVSLRGAVLAKVEPPPPPARTRKPLKKAARSMPALWSRAMTSLASLFEPGKVPPFWLAAISFLLGVALTLVGVFIAL